MVDWKTIGKKLVYPPLWLIVLLTIGCTAALIAVFVMGWEERPVASVVYALSAYTLTILCFFFVRVLPGRISNVKEKFIAHPYGHKYVTDIGYKVRVSLYISVAINLAYAVFKLISGVLYSSFWLGAFAVYYILLTLIRFLLLRYMRSDGQDLLSDWIRYRFSGVLTVLLHLSLTGIVFQMVRQNKGTVYPEVIIITLATYTFYTVTMSVIDIIRYRRYNNPAISVSKAIRFASALVSLPTMEIAMLARYGKDEGFRQVVTASTGAGVCLIVLGMSARRCWGSVCAPPWCGMARCLFPVSLLG